VGRKILGSEKAVERASGFVPLGLETQSLKKLKKRARRGLESLSSCLESSY
jgi:hypothetical protein